jgi:hypothetical protein
MSLTSESAGAMRPWPADQVERWPIERLIPYANNARLHSAADLDKIAAAIRRWGWTMPVLVDEEGVLIAGHGRVAAAPRAEVTSMAPGSLVGGKIRTLGPPKRERFCEQTSSGPSRWENRVDSKRRLDLARASP